MIDKKTIKAYNRIRKTKDKSLLCHAPFTTLNFEQNGNVSVCCFNRRDVVGRYPTQTITEMWQSDALKNLQNHIRNNDLDGGCSLCNIFINSGDFHGARALYSDEYAHEITWADRLNSFRGVPKKYFPKVFEFEISNTCNLACEMCSGYFSSTIRQKREGLPPLECPYDDAFVEQVAEYMPQLTDMKFLGGEPFMIDLYYKIWDKALEINPNIRIHITTNGSVFNSRIESLLEKMRVGIVVSIDSLDPKNYEKIRQGADFERLMKNLYRFKEITRRNKTYLTITSCVMRNNWQDIPDLVRFANQLDLSIHFNMVWSPERLSIRTATPSEINRIINFLKSQDLPAKTFQERLNVQKYSEITNILELWKKERQNRNPFSFHQEKLCLIPDEKEASYLGYLILVLFLKVNNHPEELDIVNGFFPFRIDTEENPGKSVQELRQKLGNRRFAELFIELFVPLYQILTDGDELDVFKDRVYSMKPVLLGYKNLPAFLDDIISQLVNGDMMHYFATVTQNNFENMVSLLGVPDVEVALNTEQIVNE